MQKEHLHISNDGRHLKSVTMSFAMVIKRPICEAQGSESHRDALRPSGLFDDHYNTHGQRAAKPLLRRSNRQKRKVWTKNHQDTILDKRKSVLCSDDSNFYQHNRGGACWTRPRVTPKKGYRSIPLLHLGPSDHMCILIPAYNPTRKSPLSWKDCETMAGGCTACAAVLF